VRVLVAFLALTLCACHRTAAPEGLAYVDVKQAGISLRYNSADFRSASVAQQPRLTAEENGTDVPVAVAPARTEVSFADKNEFSSSKDRSTIAFVPLYDKSVADYAKSYPQVYGAAVELKKTLQNRPAEFRPDSQLPDVSDIDQEQEMHCKVRYLDLPSLSGIGFLTQYTQEDHGTPVNNEQLYFVVQGLTKDGRYFIDARFAITHPSLPKNDDDTNKIVRDNDNQYLRKAEKDLNAQPDESFQPSIVDLQNLLASISIAPQ
jgi:hypothetical protein